MIYLHRKYAFLIVMHTEKKGKEKCMQEWWIFFEICIQYLQRDWGEKRTAMRLCELRNKEVINICSGRRLGCIMDVEINMCSGEVEAVIIPGPGKICGFLGTDCEYVIPFACVRKIGPDIVIVEIQEEKFLQKF